MNFHVILTEEEHKQKQVETDLLKSEIEDLYELILYIAWEENPQKPVLKESYEWYEIEMRQFLTSRKVFINSLRQKFINKKYNEYAEECRKRLNDIYISNIE